MLPEYNYYNVVDASCDYITLTAKHGTSEARTLDAIYDGLRFAEQFHGMNETASQALGYHGTVVGNMFLGSSQHGTMLRASGGAAHTVLETIHAFGEALHVTRLDCQITVDVETDAKELPVYIRAQVVKRQAETGLRNPPRTTIIDSGGHGDSISIGKRASQIFVRIYDKTREMKAEGPPWLWRYEVELKSHHANKALEAILNHATATAGAYAVADAYLASRLVPQFWQPASTFTVPAFEHAKTGEDKKLKWLARTVRPTVSALVKRGLRREVQQALWLLDDDDISW